MRRALTEMQWEAEQCRGGLRLGLPGRLQGQLHERGGGGP